MNNIGLINQYIIFHPVKRDGDTIYPIRLAISIRNPFVDLAVDATKNNNGCKNSGCNGSVSTIFDMPYVVKRLHNPAVCNSGAEKEIKALVALEVNDIVNGNIQNGLYGYKNAQGDVYIVSSKINGKNPDVKTNPLNRENLEYLIKTIVFLDSPDKYWNHKSPYNPIRPFSFPLHCDLKAGNILVTDKKAGIVDFEYLDFAKIFPSRFSKQNKKWGFINNYSDINGLISNLRNFEYRTLLPYLEKCDNPKDLFKQYLNIKSGYYEKMSKKYSHIEERLSFGMPTFWFNMLLGKIGKIREIERKQKAISEALFNPDKDIIKSEAMKIQIARYIYLLSTTSHGDKNYINIDQIKNYILSADKFFKNKVETSFEHKDYYETCVELMSSWVKLIPLIENGINREFLDYYRDISKVSSGADNLLETEYTDVKQPTLDEIVLD